MPGLACRCACVRSLGDDVDFPQGPLLCDYCQRMLCGTPTDRCHAAAAVWRRDRNGSPALSRAQAAIDRVVTLGSDTAALRQCVLMLKGPGHEAPEAMGQLLAGEPRKSCTEQQADAVLAVPMHWPRRLLRLANNAELIAAARQCVLKLPSGIVPRCVRNTCKQGPMLRTQR